jgi:hypothetical protein
MGGVVKRWLILALEEWEGHRDLPRPLIHLLGWLYG